MVLFCLMFIPLVHAENYDQKKILIINNLDEAIQLELPKCINTTAVYPEEIQAHNLGEVVINIEKDWLMDVPLNVQYDQDIKYNGLSMRLSLTKNKPSPDLLEAFEPGFKCSLSDINVKNYFSIMVLNENKNHCNTFYLY